MKENIIKSTHYKLILVLDQLESKEWRALKKFVLMYTREKSDNFDLFTLLRKNIHRLNTNNDIKEFHLTYFPQMTAKVFFNMMSRLTLWVEDWMVYEDIKKSDQKDIRLIRLYNSRGLYKESNTIARKAIKTAKNKPGLSLIATENLAKIYYYQYFSNNPIKFRDSKLLQNLALCQIKNFHNSILVTRNQLTYSKIIQAQSVTDDNISLSTIINVLPKTKLTDHLNHIYKLVSKSDASSLLYIKNNLERNSILKQSDLHVLSTNYLFEKAPSLWAKNKISDPKIIIDIINYSIDSGVLFTSEKISYRLWHNIIAIISNSINFDQSIKFIEQRISKVNTSNIHSLKCLSLAQVCFHQRRFHEIREHILNMKTIEPNQKNRANSLFIISLYKDRKNNFKLFIDFANNFIRQLKRSKSKLSSNMFNAYYNLTLTLISLAKSDFDESITIIEDSRHILYRKWLREEIKKRQALK